MRFSPGLQGLRGLAIVPVVAYHAYLWSFPGGWVGVDLFFVLSGYLITRLLVSEWDRNGKIDFGRFYVRRARRLVPALALYLAVAYVVMMRQGLDPTPLLAGATYSVNFAFATGHTAAGAEVAHLWSLGQEEQFYLLWPVLLLGMLAWKGPRAAGLLALVLGGLSVMEWSLIAATQGVTPRLYYAPDTHALPLMLGCAGALLKLRVGRWAGIASVFVLGVIACTSSWTAGPWASVAVAVAALGCVLAADSLPLLTARPLQELGRYSYGIYLWHPLLLGLSLQWGPRAAPVAVGASLAIAVASFHLIEQPIRRRPQVVLEPA